MLQDSIASRPRQRYEEDLASGRIQKDSAQAAAIDYLDSLYAELVRVPEKTGLLTRLLPSWLVADDRSSPSARGCYFYGGVGRGKTYVMDLFFDSLPFEQKQRTHFHRFMQQVHAGLKAYKGSKNPLVRVADSIADQARVLCFDEFFVSDIGDAMILAGLLEQLFERGVVLVATSNIHPDRLYENGLQRQRFLPAIDLVKAHTAVFELDGGVDYRLRTLEQAPLYFSPLGEAAEQAMQDAFASLASDQLRCRQDIEIEVLGRQVPARMESDGVVWFDFEALCGGVRSAFDYIELAKEYHTLLLSGVPQLTATHDDKARRFVSLVDELYDRHVKLLLSAEVDLPSLYIGDDLSFVFERTQSRLLEMQSRDYLALEHRP
jgi:cell division protein ZapE